MQETSLSLSRSLSGDSIIHIGMICPDLVKISCHVQCVCFWLPPPPPFFHILQQNRVQRDRERPFKLYLLTYTLKAVSQYGA